MLRDALIVAGKDLRIEMRSRVALWQVVPFAALVLVLFAFALGPNESSLRHVAPGLFWVAVLFSSVLVTQRTMTIESGAGTRDGLRLSGIDPAGVFLGKAVATFLELTVVEIVLLGGVVGLFGVTIHCWWLAIVTTLLATIGLSAVGVLYGAIAGGIRGRDTLLPLLVLPIVAPVLIGASRGFAAAVAANVNEGLDWLRILGPFAAVFVALGIVVYGPLLEAG
jgi:heme exporter protein B